MREWSALARSFQPDFSKEMTVFLSMRGPGTEIEDCCELFLERKLGNWLSMVSRGESDRR